MPANVSPSSRSVSEPETCEVRVVRLGHGQETTPSQVVPVGDAALPGVPAEGRTRVLDASDIRKTYGSGAAAVRALRGVTLELWSGEVVAVVGRSGCGKSTLLHVVSGLDRPDADGSIRFLDRVISSAGEDELAELRARAFGFVLQKENLVPSLTVAENVGLPLMMAGGSKTDALDRARKTLELVGLAGRERAWPADLSGGEAQRVAVARACAGTPKVIFADEPTGALDSANGSAVMDLFLGLTRRIGAAVLLATHDLTIAERADRVLRMQDGLVLGEAEAGASP